LINALLLGGKGNIGSGLRTYLPMLDSDYTVTSVDLEEAKDKTTDQEAQQNFIYLDMAEDDAGLRSVLEGRDLVVYLAQKRDLGEMNAMTDRVFRAAMEVCPDAMMVGSSSVHAAGSAYVPFDKEPYKTIAAREFDKLDRWPDPLPATLPSCPWSDYGLAKSYVEAWCRRFAANGHGAVAARWGGINARNEDRTETAYFAVWCHQEDAARFVDSCYKSHRAGTLVSGAHYFVISDNKYNIFDIETPRKEIGYAPVWDAEMFYEGEG
jgi:nucleoside-diphosphate-sugar epimerase